MLAKRSLPSPLFVRSRTKKNEKTKRRISSAQTTEDFLLYVEENNAILNDRSGMLDLFSEKNEVPHRYIYGEGVRNRSFGSLGLCDSHLVGHVQEAMRIIVPSTRHIKQSGIPHLFSLTDGRFLVAESTAGVMVREFHLGLIEAKPDLKFEGLARLYVAAPISEFEPLPAIEHYFAIQEHQAHLSRLAAH